MEKEKARNYAKKLGILKAHIKRKYLHDKQLINNIQTGFLDIVYPEEEGYIRIRTENDYGYISKQTEDNIIFNCAECDTSSINRKNFILINDKLLCKNCVNKRIKNNKKIFYENKDNNGSIEHKIFLEELNKNEKKLLG